ncbi:MAG: hypothetical protein JSV90_05955 [Methanobacteriota archaeon]|nr:MAG: hypothetical protein JSV90_05955 [Euryarchaeota archaeon]
MVKTAFVVIRSPQELDASRIIAGMSDRADAVVILFEDAVYNAVLADRADGLDRVAGDVQVARDDLEARGYESSDLKVGRAVEYADIVDTIMEATERTVSA